LSFSTRPTRCCDFKCISLGKTRVGSAMIASGKYGLVGPTRQTIKRNGSVINLANFLGGRTQPFPDNRITQIGSICRRGVNAHPIFWFEMLVFQRNGNGFICGTSELIGRSCCAGDLSISLTTRQGTVPVRNHVAIASGQATVVILGDPIATPQIVSRVSWDHLDKSTRMLLFQTGTWWQVKRKER
jgi:hypothetical protein